MDKLPAAANGETAGGNCYSSRFAEQRNCRCLRRWTRSESWEKGIISGSPYQALPPGNQRQSSADAEFDTLWRAALHAAADQPEKEINLARLATKWNLPIEASALVRTLAHSGRRREAPTHL